MSVQLTMVGKSAEDGSKRYFTYNAELHWFWAELDGDSELKRLRVEHQAALDFLGQERGAPPDRIAAALDERCEELLHHALRVREANKADEFGIHLLTIDESRGW